MKKTKYTQDEWKLGREPVTNNWNGSILHEGKVVSSVDFDEYRRGGFYSEDQRLWRENHAEFIIRACNNHSDLLAACEKALANLLWFSHHAGEQITPNENRHNIELLQDVIKKAKITQ